MDVAIIGDSYVNYPSHTFLVDLQTASGQVWPSYAVPGSSMASGGIAGFIPDQFNQAIFAAPNMTTLIMDGGGNDILLPDQLQYPGSADCTGSADSPSLQVCLDIVDAAVAKSKELMQTAVDAGVTEVVYFFYPLLPDAAAPGANPMLEYSLPLARAACEDVIVETDGAARCTFVDSMPLLAGMADVFSGDNIHLNPMGSKLLTEGIWQAMVDNCIAQPSSSGCCQPRE